MGGVENCEDFKTDSEWGGELCDGGLANLFDEAYGAGRGGTSRRLG